VEKEQEEKKQANLHQNDTLILSRNASKN